MVNLKPKTNSDKRTRYVFYPADAGEMIKLEVRHRDGGTNMFSGTVEERGIELVVTQITVESEVGHKTESWKMSDKTNARILLAQTSRYNPTKVGALAAVLDDLAPRIAADWKKDQAGTVKMVRDAVGQSA